MSSLSSALAQQRVQRVGQKSTKDTDAMKAYMEMLMNPFSTVVRSPKLLDGEVKHSAALKLRAAGEIECSATMNTNIILFPGLTNVMCYCTAPTGGDNYVGATPVAGSVVLDPIIIDGTIFKQHMATEADRGVVRLARLTGAALRLWLTNSAEEDEGYWEACRITSHAAERDVVFENDNSTPPLLGAKVLKALNQDYSLLSSKTYQFGQLRDIHKMVFKLNSTDNDHKFSTIGSLNTNYTDTNVVHSLGNFDQWDMIFIKIRGRRNATSPSILRFDTVANQEVVYSENSPLSRLMEENMREPNIEGYLEQSRVDLPGFQVTN